jgi:hypothetical protein
LEEFAWKVARGRVPISEGQSRKMILLLLCCWTVKNWHETGSAEPASCRENHTLEGFLEEGDKANLVLGVVLQFSRLGESLWATEGRRSGSRKRKELKRSSSEEEKMEKGRARHLKERKAWHKTNRRIGKTTEFFVDENVHRFLR